MDRPRHRVVPVIDILGGVVVRGVRGRRDRYRPLTSRWTSSTAPLDVADALRTHYGFRTLYVADLDGILARHRGRSVPSPAALLRALTDAGWSVWLDAGVTDRTDAERILEHGATPVVGLETLPSWDSLEAIAAACGPQVIFSIDLYRARPVRVPADGTRTAGTAASRRRKTPETVAARGTAPAGCCWQDVVRRAADTGIRRMILLDLSLVGSGQGTAAARYVSDPVFGGLPHGVQRITGGGVRSWDDCRALLAAGADAVLVASALHDGRMMPAGVRGSD